MCSHYGFFGGHMGTGKVKIFTGAGRGKTPAALGIALQRASRGDRIVIIQFLKGRGLDNSPFLKKLEPEIKLFRFEKTELPFDQMSPEQREDEIVNIRNGLHFAQKVLATGECDVLVMDEVLGLVQNRIITVEDLHQIVLQSTDTDIILTGTVMDSSICAFADEISEISTVHFKNFE